MHLGPTFALAIRRLLRRPVRSLLLLQGTVWGVAVAIFPSAVILGTREAVLEQGPRIGADRISLAADPTASEATPLTREDLAPARRAVEDLGIEVLEAGAARLLALAPSAGEPPGAEGSAALLAADPEAPRSRGLALASGRWLAPDDPPEACVVEAGLAALVGRPLAPGDRFRFPGAAEDLRVVGVLAPREDLLRRTNDLGFDLAHPLYGPLARGLLAALGVPLVLDGWKRSDRCAWVAPRDEGVDWIFLRVPPRDVSAASRAAAEALGRRGRAVIRFHALTFPLLLGSQVNRFLAVDAALFLACLAMGAVVMANLGLFTVLRRTREISIRRVEGATRRDIAWQFLGEGLLLAALGSALGVALGLLLARLRVALEPATGFTWRFPTSQAALAVAVALGVGLLASWLPARRAAALDPVEGLADE